MSFSVAVPQFGAGVASLNGLTGLLTLVAGSGISITPSGSNITIANTGAGANTALSNLTSPTAINQTLMFNASTPGNISTPNTTGSTNANNMSMIAGNSVNGAAGSANVQAGAASGSGAGGSCSITAGNSSTGNGGDLNISAGGTGGTGNGGSFTIACGSTSGSTLGLGILQSDSAIQLQTIAGDGSHSVALQLFEGTSTYYSAFKASTSLTASTTWTLPLVDGAANSVLSTNGSGVLSFVSPSGITSINSDSTAAQTLSVGTAGTDFAIANGGSGAHTFNLPTASASNRGALSSADWTTFNGKANADLSNLTNPTAINQDLTFAAGAKNILATTTLTLASTAADGSAVTVDQGGVLTLRAGVSGNGSLGVQAGNLSLVNAGLSLSPRFIMFNAAANHYVSLKVLAATSIDMNLIFPTSAPVTGQALTADSTGQLSWESLATNSLSNLDPFTQVNSDLVSESDPAFFTTEGSTGSAGFQLDATHIAAANQFTMNNSGTVGSAHLNVDAGGFPTGIVGNLYAAIYSDSAGAPGTLLGTSDALVASSYDFTGQNAVFTFSTVVSLLASTTYWVVFYGDSTYLAGSYLLTVLTNANSSNTAGAYEDGSNVWHNLGINIASSARSSTPVSLGQNGSPWQNLYVNNLIVSGSQIVATRILTGNTTLSALTDFKVILNGAGPGPYTLTFPAGIDGQTFDIGFASTNVGTWTAVGTGGDTVDANVTGNIGSTVSISATFKSGVWYDA